MTKRKPVDAFTEWQKYLIAELRAINRQQPDDLRIIKEPTRDAKGLAVVKVRLRTSDLAAAQGGLTLHDHEEFVIFIPPSIFIPPRVQVEHTRFVDQPHVLQGQRLCIYLDPAREWNPSGGVVSLLNRLRGWLSDAANGRFDPDTAMYHAVGGVLHQTDGTPTIVIREFGPSARLQTACLIQRTVHRLDMTYTTHDGPSLRLPVITLATSLPYGAGSTMAGLLAFLDDPYLDRHEGRQPRVQPQSPGIVTALAASAARNSHDSSQYFVFAVPHPAGGPPHLLGGRLPVPASNVLREVVAQRGTAIDIDPASVDPDIPIEWCTVSDERPEVTTRRDYNRPVNGFHAKHVHVWGCGGIGSWAAEFIARAGAATITLCDPGSITGGLLVRQNYVEDDIGDAKPHALARRLRAIRDDLTVDIVDGAVSDDLSAVLATVDVVVDATVSIAIGQYLDAHAAPGQKAVIAQLATDTKSGTLGILTVRAPNDPQTLTEIDQQAGQRVNAEPDLELYHGLWQEPLSGHELIPTRGCSIPTFHGSAADLAAVAASLITLLGLQLASPVTGTHLIALPHADDGPRHQFLPVGCGVES